MTTHPIIRGPGQLLATIPSLLGFDPRESIVVIGMRGATHMGILMRVDRVDCLIPEVVEPLARSIAAHLARDGDTQALVVSYTDTEVRMACDAADAVREVLRESLDRVELWAVSHGRYFCPGCADDSCCPAKGTPLPAPAAAGAASASVSATNHRSTSAVVVEIDALRRRNAGRAFQRWQSRRGTDLEAWRQESWRLWIDALDHSARSDELLAAPAAGKIIAALQDLRVRDAAILSLVPHSAKAALGVLQGREDALVTAALSKVLEPAHALRPDQDQADAVQLLCATLCAYAPAKQSAPMIAILAFMAWWDGDATRASDFCDQALRVDPGYTLAELLEATIRCHLEPGWMRGTPTKATKRDK